MSLHTRKRTFIRHLLISSLHAFFQSERVDLLRCLPHTGALDHRIDNTHDKSNSNHNYDAQMHIIERDP